MHLVAIGSIVARWAINKVALCCWHSKIAQEIGISVFSKQFGRQLVASLQKLSLESYLDISLSIGLNLIWLWFNPGFVGSNDADFEDYLNLFVLAF